MLRRAQLPPRASAGKRKRPQHLGKEAREAAVSAAAQALSLAGASKSLGVGSWLSPVGTQPGRRGRSSIIMQILQGSPD